VALVLVEIGATLRADPGTIHLTERLHRSCQETILTNHLARVKYVVLIDRETTGRIFVRQGQRQPTEDVDRRVEHLFDIERRRVREGRQAATASQLPLAGEGPLCQNAACRPYEDDLSFHSALLAVIGGDVAIDVIGAGGTRALFQQLSDIDLHEFLVSFLNLVAPLRGRSAKPCSSESGLPVGLVDNQRLAKRMVVRPASTPRYLLLGPLFQLFNFSITSSMTLSGMEVPLVTPTDRPRSSQASWISSAVSI
jgi:hypothetical protein